MISKELARKIRYIEITSGKAVNDVLAGEYESVFKGRGMEFDEVREYQPGDEVRSIDWNVTARMGHPYVKRFVEERELTVMFLVDLSASGAFGSRRMLKNEIAAEICALLAFSAIRNNDKVGLVVFTDCIELFVPPAKGRTHVLRLVRELLSFKPRQVRTNIATALDYLGRVVSRKAVVFLISDFIGSGYEKQLMILSKKHDVIALSIADPRELGLPAAGLVELEDAETGKIVVTDSGSRGVRNRYARLGVERQERLKTFFRSLGMDQVEIMTDRDYLWDLVRFFKRRERRASR